MTDYADKSLIIEIDKKITVLIDKVDTEIRIGTEFKREVKSEMKQLQARVRALELTDATNANVMDSLLSVRNTLIKSFVGIAVAALMGAYVLLTTKGP